MSDAQPERLVMGAQYAANTATAPVYGQQARGAAAPQQVPRPAPQPPQQQPNRAPVQTRPPANDNTRPSRISRWWKWVKNGLKWGRPAAAAATSPAAAGAVAGGLTYGGLAGGVGLLGLKHYQTTMNNGVRRSMGLAPRATTPFGFSSYEIKPLSSFTPPARADEEDHAPAPNGRTAENLTVLDDAEKRRRRRCRVLPYGALRGTCQPNEQAHHIVPDYTLRYGTREEGSKGLKRIGDAGGDPTKRTMTPFPSYLEGPAICLTGNAKDNGTEHWEAHGADRIIAAAGAKPGDINPIGTATIGKIKRAAIDHTSNARRDCEPEIRAAVAAAFPGMYDNRLGRTTESLPTGEAFDWLKQGTSMTRH
ncbi:hypothetical protein E2F50_22795 [Rhizobium deserti]|uniref:Uncharacterized protein n=2 Tax=Rhizobium deserti TaxID=2547961 RepID=A0A4R5U5I7_9HYPH|nr:hypothetical protein E2F50_22795 [Rhizobium deserti]